jgi:hypothetical protein
LSAYFIHNLIEVLLEKQIKNSALKIIEELLEQLPYINVTGTASIYK